MGKKSKTKGPQSRFRAQEAQPKQAFDKKASRSKRLETVEDAMGGDEDQFHLNRDTVLFEDNGKGGDDGLDEVSDEDEIFGLNLPSESDSDAADDAAASDEDEEDDDETPISRPLPIPEAPRGRFAKASNPAQDVISDAGSDDSDADSDAVAADESSEEEETWAPGSYHASRRAPGEADSSDDEALTMEAEEARRLQKRAKGVMAGDDFGLAGEGEEDVEEVRERERKGGRLEDGGLSKETALAQAAEGAEGKEMGEEEAIAFLLKKSPETLALLDDFTDTAERIKSVERNLVEVRAGGKDGKEHPALAIMELEHQALSTYLPTLAFYFSLLLTAAPSPDLVTKVLDRLSTLRSALATMEELDLTSANLDDSDSEESDSDEDGEDEGTLASEVWDLAEGEVGGDSSDEEDEEYDSEDEDDEEGMLGGLDDDELEALMDEMGDDATADDLIARVKAYKREKFGLDPSSSSPEDEDEDEEEEAGASVGSKRKRPAPATAPSRAKKAKFAAPTIPTLASLSRKSSSFSASSSRPTPAVNDDYLDPTSLSLTDSSDKASKRHTLRFHVSQVHQKTVKRESGGKNRVGGDDDLPRRSKERSRREVLKRQEHGGSKGEDLDGMDWDEEDRKVAKRVNKGGDEVDPDEYYDLVKQDKEGGKAAKKAQYDSQRLAEKVALDAETDASAAGPRAVGRKILANKGLQPKRAKVNRNSRVKKRMQYDKAVKKVATMKSVYSGGQATLGHGEYQGEKSGIGAKVVKSVRLSARK